MSAVEAKWGSRNQYDNKGSDNAVAYSDGTATLMKSDDGDVSAVSWAFPCLEFFHIGSRVWPFFLSLSFCPCLFGLTNLGLAASVAMKLSLKCLRTQKCIPITAMMQGN